MRVLILGVSGMLGRALWRVLGATPGLDVWGSLRQARIPAALAAYGDPARLRTGVDVLVEDALLQLLGQVRPEVVINGVGLIKQLAAADDPLQALPINALFPHRLSRVAALAGSRVVHISTDCVFDGRKGSYREDDCPDARDLYGQSKALGELRDDPHALTLRTSIIGHALDSQHALVDWFLAQKDPVRGFRRAVFSGLPTVELANVVRDHVLPRPELQGLYHVSAAPIDKCALLQLVAATYGKMVEIMPDDSVVLDRSLDSSRFRAVTGYQPPAWDELVRRMHASR